MFICILLLQELWVVIQLAPQELEGPDGVFGTGSFHVTLVNHFITSHFVRRVKTSHMEEAVVQ
jgi:hypothetical protein